MFDDTDDFFYAVLHDFNKRYDHVDVIERHDHRQLIATNDDTDDYNVTVTVWEDLVVIETSRRAYRYKADQLEQAYDNIIVELNTAVENR